MSDELFDKLLKVLVQIQLSIRDARPVVLPPSQAVQQQVGLPNSSRHHHHRPYAFELRPSGWNALIQIYPKRSVTALKNEGGYGAKCGAKFADTPCVNISGRLECTQSRKTAPKTLWCR
jgi:hypothetical protein